MEPLTEQQQRAAIELARAVADGMLSDRQGGHSSYSEDRGWLFQAAGVTLTPAQIDAAFRVLGERPKPIPILGACAACAFSNRGKERGYVFPCGPCARPSHSLFRPRATNAWGPAYYALKDSERVELLRTARERSGVGSETDDAGNRKLLDTIAQLMAERAQVPA